MISYKFIRVGRVPRSMKLSRGFTLIELLVVIAIIAILAAMLLPALARAKQQSQSIKCMSNAHQIMIAWVMYADDNNSLLAPNDYPYTTAFPPITPKVEAKNWATGTMEQQSDNVTSLLTSQYTVLSPYAKSATIFHCPADSFIDPGWTTNNTPHVRSYSMNSAVGTYLYSHYSGGTPAPNVGAPVDGGWLDGRGYGMGVGEFITYGKLSSFTLPGASQTICIIDENPYTINDGSWAGSAYYNGAGGTSTAQAYLIDYPSSTHGGACGLAYADGHSEIHKWQDPRTYNPLITQPTMKPGYGSSGGSIEVMGDIDCSWIAPRMSYPTSPSTTPQ
jgi:prepilin-type N-terminal cleavage/methylation domain-containing protein/prepilin-type processing-associated H-X9-DG protein